MSRDQRLKIYGPMCDGCSVIGVLVLLLMTRLIHLNAAAFSLAVVLA
jgi:hypothetical protein